MRQDGNAQWLGEFRSSWFSVRWVIKWSRLGKSPSSSAILGGLAEMLRGKLRHPECPFHLKVIFLCFPFPEDWV
jgi:hypothetical protein